MGGGSWSRNVYDRVTTRKVSTGTSFGYDRFAKSTGTYKAHETLDVIGGDGLAVTRESRDSDEHPESTPIVIGFDVTGSMGDNPRILQQELKGLFGMLVRKDVVSDPQVAIGAYGDTSCDRVPIQFSQFESDNRIDDNLDNVLIEGGGGGNHGETSTGLVWYVANHVETDAWDKRGKRGYLFLVGDECALTVSSMESGRFLGEAQQHDITPEEAFSKALERWDVYFLLVDNFAARIQGSRDKYSELIGEDHVITLETTRSAPAVIASVIGVVEGTVDDGSLTTELADAGFGESEAIAATKAVSGVSGAVSKVVDATYDELGL